MQHIFCGGCHATVNVQPRCAPLERGATLSAQPVRPVQLVQPVCATGVTDEVGAASNPVTGGFLCSLLSGCSKLALVYSQSP